MTPLFATVSRVSSAHSVGQGGGGGSGYRCVLFTLTTRVGYNNGNEDRRLIKMSH